MKYKMSRTTLGVVLSNDDSEDFPGIYTLSSYPSLGCLYIGLSIKVKRRIRQHLQNDELIANLVRNLFTDACSWRIDLFHIDDAKERIKYERELIQYFRPMFNTQGLGEGTE